MHMYSFIFVAFVGSVVGFDRRLQLSAAGKREIVRSKISDILNSRMKSDSEIIEEATTNSVNGFGQTEKHSDITEEEVTVTSVTGCVQTDKQLQDAVLNANTEGPYYTRIDLCSRSIMINEDYPFGIDVSDRWIDIRCGQSTGRCALNGQGLYAIIFGAYTNMKTDRVDFVNGAINIGPMFFVLSNVEISRSSFLNNSGTFSALVIFDGDFLKLRDVTFVKNSAEDANVYLYNITKTTIIGASFKSNKESALYVEEGSNLDLSKVTFERTFTTKMGSLLPYTVYVKNIAKTNIVGALFKNNSIIPLVVNSIIPLVVNRGASIKIENTRFDSNYNNESLPSAVLVAYTTVTFKTVRFLKNILNEKEGNVLGIFFSLTRLDGCRFVDNTGPAMSSSVRVYDGGDVFGDGGFAGTKTILSCSNTNFCDGFPSKKTIIDQFSNQFNASTCKPGRRC